MSYDFHIGDKSFNHTFNCAPMFQAAAHSPEGIKIIQGLRGRLAVMKLRSMRMYFEDHRQALMMLNPKNNWGSYATAYQLLSDLILASLENPDDIWEVFY